MTPEDAYKVGFLLRCADEGLTQDEILVRVRQARGISKEALWPSVAAATGSGVANMGGRAMAAVPSLLQAGTVLGLGLPLAGGAAAGYTLAKATNNNKNDVEEAKQDEIEGEYYRLAQEARRNAARKRLSAITGRRVSLVGPGLT